MSLEDEAKVVAQEQEMLAQQQGAQQVRSFLFLTSLLSSCRFLSLYLFRTSHRFTWFYPLSLNRPRFLHPMLRAAYPSHILLLLLTFTSNPFLR